MERTPGPHGEFWKLSGEIHDWTPEKNRLSTLRDLFNEMKRPTISAKSIMRIAEKQCDPDRYYL